MAIGILCERSRTAKAGLSNQTLTAIAIGACMLLALVLRVFMVRGSGIWCDEAQFLWIVRFPSLGAMIEFLRYHESHPPLFYLLMRAWLAVFGDTEVAALTLPIGLGVALVPAVYLVGNRTLGRRTGLIATVLVATSPVLALHAGLVRPYTLLPLLCLISVFTLWRGLCVGRTRTWIAHAAVTLAMLLTHNWTWMVLGAEWLVAGAWLAAVRGGPRGMPARSWVLTQFAIMAGYAPWLPTLLFQSRHAGHGPAPVNPLDALSFFARSTTSLPLEAATVLVLALIGMAIWSTVRPTAMGTSEGADQQLAILLFLAIPFIAFTAATVLSAHNNLLKIRCLLTVTPCVLLALAHGINSMSAMPRTVLTGILTLGYMVVSASLFGNLKSNAREMAPAVAANSRPSDLIMIEPRFYASSFMYYHTNGNYDIKLPQDCEQAGALCYDDVGDRLRDPESMRRLRAALVRAHAEGRRIWLVTPRDTLSDDVPDGDRLPPDLTGKIAYIRSNQIRKCLNSLYGPPDLNAVPEDNREGEEVLRVFLYSTDHPLSARNSIQGRVPRPAPSDIQQAWNGGPSGASVR